MDEICSLWRNRSALIVAIRVIVILHQASKAIVSHLHKELEMSSSFALQDIKSHDTCICKAACQAVRFMLTALSSLLAIFIARG